MRVACIGLAALAGLAACPASARPTFGGAPATCAVLQAAYVAAVDGKKTAHPLDVRASGQGLGGSLQLDAIVPAYKTRMSLTGDEFANLAARQAIFLAPTFRPTCRWKGDPGPQRDEEGHARYVTFTSPIFTTDRRLALVEVSFRENGRFGYGDLCVVRRERRAWAARCLRSWIT